ncbi:hypothetical protein [Candidatus Amarobacter glycogenicus]|uniref:hypothetical protein n=1 Tax=Candidatus Amarobacter glycogenicus TaxID=3140699 RepID=UPI0031CC68AC
MHRPDFFAWIRLFLCPECLRSTIRRPARPLDATVQLPHSKSVSNRALPITSLLDDLSLVSALSDGDDTRVMHTLLRDDRIPWIAVPGTTCDSSRAAVQDGEEHLITGIPRLLERPHDDLVEALRTLGADIKKTSKGYRGAR